MKKYSVWQKIQAILCFLILLCALAPLALIAISPSLATSLLDGVLLDAQMSGALALITWMQRAVIGAGVLIAMLCALRMLVLVFARDRKVRAGVSLSNTAEGAIHISIPAVETLVSQGIRDIPGIGDVRMKVLDYHDSISIEITMSARSDINIPETMLRLQTRIKNYVQEAAGVEVRDVRLNVDRVILADAMPALPAGRGMRRQAEEIQSAYAPQTPAWKPETEVPAKPDENVVIDAAHTVHDDKSSQNNAAQAARKGWFGRMAHKRREEKPEAVIMPAASSDDEVASVPEFLRRYEMGDEAVSADASQPETADAVETETVQTEPAAEYPESAETAETDESASEESEGEPERVIIADTSEDIGAAADGKSETETEVSRGDSGCISL